jgi:hypothetical protein
MSNNNAIRLKIERDFEILEAQLEAGNPGVLDILRAYGNVEETIRLTETYLGNLVSVPRVTISNTSG